MRYHQIHTLLAPIIVIFFAYILNRRVLISDGDTFWHLASGRLILESGFVPILDSFSFNTQGKEWINTPNPLKL